MAHRWLGGLALCLMLALVGCGAPSSPPPSATPAAPAAPSTSATATGGPYGAMEIARTSNGFRLTGEVPDDALRASLPDSIRQAMPGAKIVDQLTVKPGVKPPEFGGLGALFGVAMDTKDFSASLAGGTVTLKGVADSADSKAAAEASAKTTWPNVPVRNDIRVAGSASPAPTPAPAGSCATLGADVAGVLSTPITFATNQATLTAQSRHALGQVAATAKACPNARLVVTGYTDATGTDAVNLPLSASRAKAAAEELVSAGLPATAVTTKGAGAANPVADNSTAAGRAMNRRVDVTVG